MIDRQKLETLLSRRFPGAVPTQVAAAANAIMGLDDDWEEVGDDTAFGFRFSGHCVDVCSIAREAEAGSEFRLLRRRPDAPGHCRESGSLHACGGTGLAKGPAS